MCGYFCIVFIDSMFGNKTLIYFTSLSSPYDFEKNDNIILSYFKNERMQFYQFQLIFQKQNYKQKEIC